MPQDYDDLRDYLRQQYKVDHDPIQARGYILTAKDLRVLEEEHGVKPLIFLQCLGDVAVIPGNLPHQVLNINSCVKMAFDFMSHSTCDRHIKNVCNLVRPATNREDYIGIFRVMFHALCRAMRTLISATSLQQRNLRQAEEISHLKDKIKALERDIALQSRKLPPSHTEETPVQVPVPVNPPAAAKPVTPTATILVLHSAPSTSRSQPAVSQRHLPQPPEHVYTVQCGQCCETFHSDEELGQHLLRPHEPYPQVYSCSECLKAFQNEGELKTHRLTHKKICPVCQKRYFLKPLDDTR